MEVIDRRRESSHVIQPSYTYTLRCGALAALFSLSLSSASPTPHPPPSCIFNFSFLRSASHRETRYKASVLWTSLPRWSLLLTRLRQSLGF
jgi:hypothetical protein